MKNKFVAWLWKYANSEEFDIDEEDFNEFLEEYKKRRDKIKEVYHPKDNEELKQIALSFANSYSQRKMVEANKNLVKATWILALATIVFTISNVWGATTASNIVDIGLKIVLFIAFLAFIGLILKLINQRIKKLIKFILSRTPHILCYKCGRIITEYEKEGDNKPAYTTCPECMKKK